MAKKHQPHNKNTPESVLPLIDDIIAMLHQQIEKGESLIVNRPIPESDYEYWETRTTTILKKSSPVDPTAVNRFLACGAYGDSHRKSNEAFWENHRAMSVYDKIKIVDYHLHLLKKIKIRPELILEN
jgi:hypothetical protein